VDKGVTPLFDNPGYPEHIRGETMTRTLRVAIADDHPITRCAVRTYLGCFDDIEVVAEAASGKSSTCCAANASTCCCSTSTCPARAASTRCR
jgi:hypothetical protein